MHVSLLLALTLLAEAPAAAPQPAAPPASAPAATAAHEPELVPYQLVILQRPAQPREYPQEKLDEIQKEHLAHLMHLAETGKLVVAGPLGDQPDPRMRGLELFDVGSTAEAKRLAEEDPAVKAGRLEVVVMTWYVEKGALAFPMSEKLRKPQP